MGLGSLSLRENSVDIFTGVRWLLGKENGRDLLRSQLQAILEVKDKFGFVFVVSTNEVHAVFFHDRDPSETLELPELLRSYVQALRNALNGDVCWHQLFTFPKHDEGQLRIRTKLATWSLAALPVILKAAILAATCRDSLVH